MRDFLFYISPAKGKCEAELFGKDRIYDVAINDYTESNINPEEAEYKFSIDEYKYRHIKKELADIVFNYKAVAIFDDDVRISTESINKLFMLGYSLDFNLWQAALTPDSYSPWVHLFQKKDSYFRLTNTMEIMMPFFSKSALEKCWESFDLNYCAWGLDVAWYHLLKGEKIMVVDAIPANHVRPLVGQYRVMPNGKHPWEEAEIIFNHYKINKQLKVF